MNRRPKDHDRDQMDQDKKERYVLDQLRKAKGVDMIKAFAAIRKSR